jgi:hypothetical protein
MTWEKKALFIYAIKVQYFKALLERLLVNEELEGAWKRTVV